jgi:hypothetical protein
MNCKINREKSILEKIDEDFINYEFNKLEEIFLEKNYYNDIDDKITKEFLIMYLFNRNIQIEITDNMINYVKKLIIENMKNY